jgi:putative restriction endonuclease
LFQFLQSPLDRDLLRETLVLHWFPDQAKQLFDHIGVTEFELSLQAGATDKEKTSPVRSSAFRRLVIEAYDFRCAATGWRILLPDYSSLVEAAHIIPFAETADDRPQNGLALTPTFHRALDKGMIAPGPDLKWHVSEQLDRIPDNSPLLDLEGQDLRLPRDARYKPDLGALDWRLSNLV